VRIKWLIKRTSSTLYVITLPHEQLYLLPTIYVSLHNTVEPYTIQTYIAWNV